MPTAGSLRIEGRTVVLREDWVLSCFNDLRKQVAAARSSGDLPVDNVDWSGLDRLDSAGATLIAELLGSDRLIELAEADTTMAKERKGLLLAVGKATSGLDGSPPARALGIRRSLASVGRRITAFASGQKLLAGFIGLTLSTLVSIIPLPRRWRVTALVAHIQRTGLNALPIVALLTFLVGAVVAFLGATVLENFGATIYTVHLVWYLLPSCWRVALRAPTPPSWAP